ncbi:serum response factor-binding protein 1-like [Daphnia carinata]|uniref:serum response factor-binding protein 1-like n=1 Tax=Daphnia carinata TaxID=120202 RepID=UPI00257C3930|nr:serum response factor-binding protein 1-like [Daphnia carinata]
MTTINGMEKLAVNNQIVRMRKDVKRARLWLINRLTQRVKKLKGNKANELEKNQLKAEKLRKKICIIKGICIDEVSKFALCNKNDSSSLLLSESELGLSQKLMLQLANHRLVQQQVQVFRQTYTGPMDRLILLVRSLGLQYQKKKVKKSVDCDSRKNYQEEGKIVCDTQKRSCGSKKIISETEIESTSTSGCMLNSLCRVNSVAVTNNKHKDLLKKDEACSTGNSNVKKSQSEKTLAQKVPWPKFSVPPVNKKIGTMIIKQVNLENEADAISLDETSEEQNSRQNINRTPRPRDSFFLGGVDSSSDDEVIKDNSNLQRVNKITNSKVKESEDEKCSQASRSRHKLSNRKPYTKPAITSVPITEILHPSWQAKRKEKELQIKIGVCHGKKIRFDDN